MRSPGSIVATPMKPEVEPTVFGLRTVRTSPPRRVSASTSSADRISCGLSAFASVGGVSSCDMCSSWGRLWAATLLNPCPRSQLRSAGCRCYRPVTSGKRYSLPARFVLDIGVVPGGEEDLTRAYPALRARLEQGVPGLLEHELCQNVDDPGRWILTSEWESLEASTAWDRSEEHD